MGQRATLLGIIGGDHWIIARQAERFAVAFRRIAVLRDMPAQHLVLLAVDHADQIIGLDRSARRNRATGLLRLRLGRRTADCLQRAIHALDQAGDFGSRDTVVADMRGYNVGS